MSTEEHHTLPSLHPSIAIPVPEDEGTATTYAQVLTPLATAVPILEDEADEPPKVLQVTKLVYTSAFLAMMQAMLYGWSLSQVNYFKFNNKTDCDRRPVTPGTCLMFPGHTSTEWIFVVNSWAAGGIFGGLLCGLFADKLGRKRTLTLNCVLMSIGAIIQAASPSLPVFCVGRFITGIATGTATATCNSYVSEISPPHLRSTLGSIYGVAIGSGIFLVGLTPFFAATSSGWRYIAAFPIVFAVIFLPLAPNHLAESPSWLMTHGRHEEAKQELARLYGEDNVDLALSWIKRPAPEPQVEERASSTSEAASAHHDHLQPLHHTQQATPAKTSTIRSLLSKQHRKKLILAIFLALAMQFSGINAVFFYSSSMFKDAGIEDSRIGSLIVNLFNLLPAVAAGPFIKWTGNRGGIIVGPMGMLLSAIGLTVARVHHVSALSIVFISTYVISFSICLGALAFAVGTSLFPQSLRATGTSIMMCINWCGAFTIGVGYPFLASSLNEYAFVPFIGTLSFFIVFFSIFLPDTTGKTPAEIQELFDHAHVNKSEPSSAV
ncbi:hypothetical protein Poli38472_007852 [Pythium oligandrum]|uniref:Hexose transporter 1 n=1 Tax=Pythium oligandrum TaxID=41045 RepID=A0A8K1CT13_PYTOL|nr:hypothetical protein Poli38472_007852 [Pythium oligandrum]|eukprot:TMW68180.1 hypothetical protein Poli38472_007852 [Pythium oligandrum]